VSNEVLTAINDKIGTIMYTFANDDALKALGIKDEVLALEDHKKDNPAPTAEVQGVDKETHPPSVSYRYQLGARCLIISYMQNYECLISYTKKYKRDGGTGTLGQSRQHDFYYGGNRKAIEQKV
jgi:hypothetical protein